jgi:DNA-binding beta-propeller fold protein YncE
MPATPWLVLDGRNNYAFASTLSTGSAPSAMAVNPLTDLLYVANSGSNDVTVVNGASNATTLFGVDGSFSVNVNPLTNKGYIATTPGNNLLVIDGATNVLTSVPVGQQPIATLVNARGNKIYTLNFSSGCITAIDGMTLELAKEMTTSARAALEQAAKPAD